MSAFDPPPPSTVAVRDADGMTARGEPTEHFETNFALALLNRKDARVVRLTGIDEVTIPFAQDDGVADVIVTFAKGGTIAVTQGPGLPAVEMETTTPPGRRTGVAWYPTLADATTLFAQAVLAAEAQGLPAAAIDTVATLGNTIVFRVGDGVPGRLGRQAPGGYFRVTVERIGVDDFDATLGMAALDAEAQ